MKTLQEFEQALLNNEEVYVGDGFVIVEFYAAMRNPVCGLVTVCVDVAIPIRLEDKRFHRSQSVCSSMEAYLTYSSLYKKFHDMA